MTDRIEFTIPFALPSLNVRDGRKWYHHQQDKKALYMQILAAVGGRPHLPAEPFERARITVIRCSAGTLDPDSVAATCKNMNDVLCVPSRTHPFALGVIRDDSTKHIELIVQQAPAKRGQGSTRVTIERMP